MIIIIINLMILSGSRSSLVNAHITSIDNFQEFILGGKRGARRAPSMMSDFC